MDVNIKNNCNRCGSPFRDARDLKRHLERKTPCLQAGVVAVVENRCIYCNHGYSNKYNLAKHQKTCKAKRVGAQKMIKTHCTYSEDIDCGKKLHGFENVYDADTNRELRDIRAVIVSKQEISKNWLLENKQQVGKQIVFKK